MNKLEKIMMAGKVFYWSAKSQMKNPDTLEIAGGIALLALIYGSKEEVIKTFLGAFIGVTVFNGISNVMENYDKIKNL